MIKDAIGIAVIILCCVCLAIIVFAPTIYAAWFYVVSRRLRAKSTRLLKTAVCVFLVNGIITYLLFNAASNYFVTFKSAEKDAIAAEGLRNAIASQQRFFGSHGRYYPVGPVRGPYQDEHGLMIDKDVILEVTPVRHKETGAESFDAYAFHVWGKTVQVGRSDGGPQHSLDLEEATKIRARLFNSVK